MINGLGLGRRVRAERRDDLADGYLDCLGKMAKAVSVEDGVNPAEQSWKPCSHSYCITSFLLMSCVIDG